MKKALTLAYGTTCYAIFFAAFLYLVGFLGNLFVPTSVDVGQSTPLGTAILIDVALIALFGLQHSVMARPGFKKVWTRIVPKPVERSTYVLATSAVLALMYWQWRPIGGVVWDATGTAAAPVMWGLFASGWLLILLATFAIDHFDLFGLKQVFNFFRGKQHADPEFRVKFFYKFVRHPLYVGWTIAFFATPFMTAGHLILAAGMLSYMLIAIQFEERDLIDIHGQAYVDYKKQVPMLLPLKSRKSQEIAEGALS